MGRCGRQMGARLSHHVVPAIQYPNMLPSLVVALTSFSPFAPASIYHHGQVHSMHVAAKARLRWNGKSPRRLVPGQDATGGMGVGALALWKQGALRFTLH